MSENDRRVESQIIVRELRKMLPPSPTVVAAYLPYIDEPNITPLLEELLKQKNVICMPKVVGNHLTMYQIFSLSEVKKNPATGILEPMTDQGVDEAMIETVIVPGRAFTKEGLRMGRGNVRATMPKLLPLVVDNAVPLTSIITHVLPLRDGVKGYELFGRRRDVAIKVLLKP